MAHGAHSRSTGESRSILPGIVNTWIPERKYALPWVQIRICFGKAKGGGLQGVDWCIYRSLSNVSAMGIWLH